MVGHLINEFKIKDATLLQYCHLVDNIMKSCFDEVTIQHIHRGDNTRADALSQLASTKHKGRYKSLLQQTLVAPSTTNTCLNLERANSWMTPYEHYLKTENPPDGADKGWLSKGALYTLIGDDLHKRGYGQPLLKYVTKEHAHYVIKEIHERIYGYHFESRTMTTRILRVDYFWPTMEADCHAFVRKCIPCQKHDNFIHQKHEELHPILSPLPFAKWGINIMGSFTLGKGQVKFLIVGIDYFTKWIETKLLATIMAQQIEQFV